MMTSLALSILGAIICGIVMVIGGIVLLYKGAIKLEVLSKDPALTVELFNKQLSVTTRAPALGLFVIGMMFVGGSLWVARDTDVQKIPVSAEIDDVDEPITATVYTSWGVAASKHEVSAVLRPALDILWLKIEAPGYEPLERANAMSDARGGIKLGKVKLVRAVPKIEPKEENIAPLPFEAPKFDPQKP